MSNNTNPFQIRLELLKLAQGTLFDPVYAKRDQMLNEYESLRETQPNIPYPTLPKFPTTEDIIEEAKKFNEFISNG